ncbi:hypothetical protein, partial [Schlesneria paludicola]|uniref:hypothetical protein n=1 Tax=Schlesneria paludicola TaxID=360056 RepID=UPI00029A28A6
IAAIGSGKNPLTAANDAFISTLAGQQDEKGAGKNHYQAFADAFSQTYKDSIEGLNDQGGLSAGLKSRRDALLNGIGEREFQLTNIAKPNFEPSPDATDEEEGNGKKKKEKKEKADKSDSKAALIGSSDAAATLLRGVFGGDIDKQQLNVQKQQLAETKKTNAALANSRPIQVANP